MAKSRNAAIGLAPAIANAPAQTSAPDLATILGKLSPAEAEALAKILAASKTPAQAPVAPAEPATQYKTPARPIGAEIVGKDDAGVPTGKNSPALDFGQGGRLGIRKLLNAYLYPREVEAFLRAELGAELDVHIARAKAGVARPVPKPEAKS